LSFGYHQNKVEKEFKEKGWLWPPQNKLNKVLQKAVSIFLRKGKNWLLSKMQDVVRQF
jgi:hypothetical protein